MDINQRLISSTVMVIGLMVASYAQAGPMYSWSRVDGHPGSVMNPTYQTNPVSLSTDMRAEPLASNRDFGIAPELAKLSALRAAPNPKTGANLTDSSNGGVNPAGVDLSTAWKDPRNEADAAAHPVPEPASLALLGMAVASAAFAFGHRRHGHSKLMTSSERFPGRQRLAAQAVDSPTRSTQWFIR